MYTALSTEAAPTVPMNRATGTDSQVSAPTIKITPTSSPAKRGLLVGMVPGPAGVIFFFTIDPASASTGTMNAKRPMIIANAPVQL